MAQPLFIEPLPPSFTVSQLIGLVSLVGPVASSRVIRLKDCGWIAGIVELKWPEDAI